MSGPLQSSDLPPAFGRVRQIAFVTRDLHQSMARFSEQLGIGPWFYELKISFGTCLDRGQPIDITIGAAIANSWQMRFELIQQNGNEPSVYQEYLRGAAGAGLMHHVSFCVTDLGTAQQAALLRGYEIVQEATPRDLSPLRGDVGLAARAERLGETKARIFDAVEQAAQGWDGTKSA